ncbi:GntR family transcriptional regulator [Cupriavidus sp. 30B13]|uniref:GntR family transcriptional regulator n=1 Tax=Cupriavidus sp. 30B13 TaxID=3384241 RepID=UPI003B917CC4
MMEAPGVDAIAQWLPETLRTRERSGLPKYLQLRDAVSDAIDDTRLRGGDKLPAEETLAQISGFSLGTVQRALANLAEDGLVVRRQGSGTFVAAGERPMTAPFYHCRFLDEGSGEILPIFSHAIGKQTVTESGPWSAHLPGAAWHRVDRIFSVNNEFDLFTSFYVVQGRFPELEEEPVEALNGINLKEFLARKARQAVTRFSETLTVGVFPAAACRAIGVKPGTAGATLEIRAFDKRGDAVYFQTIAIPPNPRRLLLSS